jgi:hypothetical protein
LGHIGTHLTYRHVRGSGDPEERPPLSWGDRRKGTGVFRLPPARSFSAPGMPGLRTGHDD